MGPVYHSDFLSNRRGRRHFRDMEKYLNSYGYKIYDEIVRIEHTVYKNGPKIYDEIVRQEQAKEEINNART